ncbi:MAG: PIN domain-containing protein [Dehalococcoidia bacterium]
MLWLLVDTSVWLDLARSRDGQALIVPIRALTHWQRLKLLVPQIVIDEFERNRPIAEARVAQSVADRFRELRRDLHEYADPERLDEWLDEMTHQVPMISAMTLQNFREISELLAAGQRLEPTTADHEQVIRRALDKRAPFHLPKNSVADALLIELYRSALDRFDTAERLCFATANYEDFSAWKGDRRRPHSDFADLFDDNRSRYVYGVDGLRAVLAADFGEEFAELAEEIHLGARGATNLRRDPRRRAGVLRQGLVRPPPHPPREASGRPGRSATTEHRRPDLRRRAGDRGTLWQGQRRPLGRLGLGLRQRQAVRPALGPRQRLGLPGHLIIWACCGPRICAGCDHG